jgi:putative DNA primase/helicase
MSRIFADNAPLYWAAGLPAIPLIKDTKRPAVNGWQVFADRQPTNEERDAWLRVYGDGNIGLPMGPASGLVAIDIDTDDEKIIRILDQLLPPSPWRRRGKKGEVRIYRYSGEKTTRIQSTEGMVCEVLSKGTQIVLPPSIHPETKAPYQANRNLYELVQSIPMLIPGMEDMIRMALVEAGYPVGTSNSNKVTNFVPAGQRDNTMTWHAGLLARAVTRGERSLLEVLGEMKHWVESYVEKVVGDTLTVEKAQQKVVHFIVRDVTGVRKMALPIGWDEGLSDEDRQKLGLTFSEEDEKWTATRILENLAVEFQRFPDANSEGFQNAVNQAMDRLSRSEGALSVIDEDRVMKFIASQSSSQINIATLRKQLRTLRKGDIEGENHNEIAQEVHKFLNEYGELRFHAGAFWQWKGSHWEKKPEDEIMKVIATEFGFYPACRKSSDYRGVLLVLRATAAKQLKLVNTRGINFANGYLDEDLTMKDHHPDFGCTYVLAYRYLPELAGRMPLMNQFMSDSWGHDADYKDKEAAFQEALGATLFSVAPRYQRAICLYGQAGSGKSVASQIVRSMLPKESLASIPPEKWSDTFLPAELFGKVMNFAGELSESQQIPGDIFKQIVEGEQITGQYKNRDPFTFKPTCAHWFNSNHLPKTKDTSDGFNRRWLFVEWTKSVPKEKRIPDLAIKIVDAEREAIVAWAVQGFARVQAQGDYTLPTSHMALVDQMSTENNSVRYFLATSPLIIVGKTRTEGKKSRSITANDLYSEYWSFCLATGIAKRVASNTFVRMMHDLQHAYEFKVISGRTGLGAQEVFFDGITLVAA